jgi:hypothetical protein
LYELEIIFYFDSRCSREQQRAKIVELMNLRSELAKMENELKQENAAKIAAENKCGKVTLKLGHLKLNLQLITIVRQHSLIKY